MIAQWFGGPYDGRVDELPMGTDSVRIAHPTKIDYFPSEQEMVMANFREVRCPLQYNPRNRGWLIMWREPSA